MKRTLSIRPEAQRDIKEAISWYETRKRGLGLRFKDEIRTILRRIGDNALMFPAIDNRVSARCLGAFHTPCISWLKQRQS